jgi:hypothetical protein
MTCCSSRFPRISATYKNVTVPTYVDLLPPGVVDIAVAWQAAGRALLGSPEPADRSEAERQLVLPLVIEPNWPEPVPPLETADGWVQADVIEADRETFERLRERLPRAGSEDLSETAQELRLPVLPYRSGRWPTGPDPLIQLGIDESSHARFEGSLEGVSVIDMTAMWAGPMATKLMVEVGATVTKIDPDCRPDGFRARPGLYSALNGGKKILDLDLTVERDRDHFEGLVADADLLIESFSRRVMPNLGYGSAELRALNPRLATLSVVGFPQDCPEQDWLAFGSGIHAISGHGMSTGTALAAAVGYPDPIAGYAAFARGLQIIGTSGHAEISLIAALMASGSGGLEDMDTAG